jgi:hypothetical protein
VAEERKRALEDLTQLRAPVRPSAQTLKGYLWDSESKLVVLTRLDCRRLITAYLNGDLSGDDWEVWAEALEVRDDVGVEEGFEDLIKGFLFEIATPEITRQLTPSTAEEWMTRFA